MSAVVSAKTIGPVFGNSEDIVTVYYDFASDAGAQGALDLFTAGSDVVITHIHMVVSTTCAGTGGVLTVGVTGDDDKLVSATQGAMAKLVAGYSLLPPAGFKLASGEKIYQTIATADFTAGKIKYVVKYTKL